MFSGDEQARQEFQSEAASLPELGITCKHHTEREPAREQGRGVLRGQPPHGTHAKAPIQLLIITPVMIVALLRCWTSPRWTSGLLTVYWWNSVRRPSEGPVKSGGVKQEHIPPSVMIWSLHTFLFSPVQGRQCRVFSPPNIAFS